MSDIQQLGPDRCLMSKGKLSRFVHGGERIKTLIAAGWVIEEDPRNFVRGDYGQDMEEPITDPLTGITLPFKEKIEMPDNMWGPEAPVIDPPKKNKGGRPRGSKNK